MIIPRITYKRDGEFVWLENREWRDIKNGQYVANPTKAEVRSLIIPLIKEFLTEIMDLLKDGWKK
jgi:hypothetical protein